VISNRKVENEAKLAAKYKGTRFFDADIEEGTYNRVRSDQFTWAGKRAGGWLATCDEMCYRAAPLRTPRRTRGVPTSTTWRCT